MALTLDFILAGDAVFTVSNGSKHYTFKVTKADGPPHPVYGETFFAALLTGPDNTADYTYLGLVKGLTLQATKKSPKHLVTGERLVARTLEFALRIAAGKQALPEGYSLQHEGKCGRCGRPLTVPSSIESGIGPECAKKLAGAA